MTHDFLVSNISGYQGGSLGIQDKCYLDRFWLDGNVLTSDWCGVLERCFVVEGRGVSISPGARVDIRMGGVLFSEEEFGGFVFDSRSYGASGFVVIEDIGQKRWDVLEDRSFFRFYYPIDVGWGEVAESCDISFDVYRRPIRSYFVVSDNGRIGKYANNDAVQPYDIVFYR